MKTSPQMQRIITRLAARHDLDLAAAGGHLKLENGDYAPLVIEKVGPTLLSAAHYVEENGDLVADPEVVFFTGYSQWVPIEITQRPPGGYRVCAELSGNGREIARLDISGQAALASFVETWANNLLAQGWLERARRAAEAERKMESPLPILEHLGAAAHIAQAAFDHGNLYHTVLIGHQTALKALRAALLSGQYLSFPDTGQVPRPRYPYYSYEPAVCSVCRVAEVTYRSRIVGDAERGLYTMALWADARDLLEKGGRFYLVDPHAAPVPIPEYEYGAKRPALAPPSADTLTRFYAWLNEALLTPLREEWAGRLWEEGSRRPAWSPLVSAALSLGCAGWVVRVEEEKWEEIVREIAREGGDG